jgi:tetratricopeptide (TPR) repeat protein
MKTETANSLALCLANNPNNVADLLIVRDDGTYDRGWYASRVQLGEGVPVVTLASRPERRPQIASFDVAMEKLVAVKVELSSGEDHYFGERAVAVAAEVQQLLQIAALALEEGSFADALSIADRTVELAAGELGSDHPLTICSMASAGDICRRLGRFDAAAAHLDAAAERARRIMDAQDPNRTAAIENLAVLLLDLGDLDGADALFTEVINLRQRAPAVDRAKALCSISLIKMRRGELERAAGSARQAIAMLDDAGVTAHPIRARATHNLGMALGDSGDLQAARPLLEQSLEQRQALLGERHLETIESLASLGTLHFVARDYRGAEALQRKALELAERALGADHLEVARRAADLALSYKHMQTPEAAQLALPLLEKVHDIRAKHLGQTHPDTLSIARELSGLRAALA